MKCVQVRCNQVSGERSQLLAKLRTSTDNLLSLKPIINKDRCDVQFLGRNLATMNTKFQGVLYQLSTLDSVRSIRFEAFTPRAEFIEQLQGATQNPLLKPPNLFLLIDVQIFGNRNLANAVAKVLCKHHMFLQHPVPSEWHLPYENPQCLKSGRSSFLTGFVQPRITDKQCSKDTVPEQVVEELDQHTEDLNIFINNLPARSYLQEAVVDKRITTDLFRQVHF